MNLLDVAQTDYILLQANWPAEKGVELIEAITTSRIIVRRLQDSNEYFYLYPQAAVLDRLKSSMPGADIESTLNLHETDAVPTMDGNRNLESMDIPPFRLVVLENGRPTGYLDATTMFEPTDRAMHFERGGSDIAEDNKSLQRSLLADMDDPVELNATVTLHVSISSAPVTSSSVPLGQPVGTIIDIVVSPRHGFLLAGSGEGSLTISDDDNTPTLEVKLTATEEGVGDVRIYAFHNGHHVGSMKLQPTVAPATDTGVSTGSNKREVSLSPATLQNPDLVLFIEQESVNGQLAFTFRLTAREPDLDLSAKKYGPLVLRSDPGRYFEQLYQGIDGLPLDEPADRAIAAQRLINKGTFLYNNLIPPEVQAQLVSLRPRIKTVYIQSEEPWVPWELCTIPDGSGGFAFLCEVFAVSRWIPGGTSPRPNLKLQQIALVVPSNSGLAFATQERDYVRSLASEDRQVTEITARFLSLTEALGSKKYDAWHFTGHGVANSTDPDNAAIELEDRPFTPVDLSSVMAQLKPTRPFVFLNSCQVGAGGLSLTTIGGWAKAFLDAGASAFIAPLWSVYDETTLNFAKSLYSLLISGRPLADAVRAARLAIKSGDDPTTWLAYTVYGDPFATVRNPLDLPGRPSIP